MFSTFYATELNKHTFGVKVGGFIGLRVINGVGATYNYTLVFEYVTELFNLCYSSLQMLRRKGLSPILVEKAPVLLIGISLESNQMWN